MVIIRTDIKLLSPKIRFTGASMKYSAKDLFNPTIDVSRNKYKLVIQSQYSYTALKPKYTLTKHQTTNTLKKLEETERRKIRSNRPGEHGRVRERIYTTSYEISRGTHATYPYEISRSRQRMG